MKKAVIALLSTLTILVTVSICVISNVYADSNIDGANTSAGGVATSSHYGFSENRIYGWRIYIIDGDGNINGNVVDVRYSSVDTVYDIYNMSTRIGGGAVDKL